MKNLTVVLICLFGALLCANNANAFESVCNRTKQVKEEIERWTEKSCVQINIGDLQGISTLSLDQKDIVSLDKDDFNGLTGLKNLELDINKLTKLPKLLFKDLAALESLYLHDNNLTEVDPSLFRGLVNLKELTLEINISELPADLFSDLKNLKKLSIYSNVLLNLSSNDFQNLNSLEEIYLNLEAIQNLPEDVFKNLNSIQSINLNGSTELKSLPKKLFRGLTKLKKIGFYNNCFSYLPVELFRGLNSLESFGFSDNKKDFTFLPGMFEDLPSLDWISIGRNQISSLPIGMFHGLTKPTFISIEENTLSNIEAGIFNGEPSIRGLSIRGNKITTLPPKVFEGLHFLEDLYLEDNLISSLPVGVFDGLSNLRELRLLRNKLETLPAGVFEGLSKLEELNIQCNQLKFLPVGVFNGLSNLKSLDLFINQISELDAGVLAPLKSISKIELGDNNISVLKKGVFDGLVSDFHISFVENKINLIEDEVFPPSLDQCQFNGFIDLRDNPISEFPAALFPKLRNPYQCPLVSLTANTSILDQFFHINLLRLDANTLTITQVEQTVPRLEAAFTRDLFQMPITAHYGFNLIPSLDGTVGGLNAVRQLAVDVCALVPSFCPIRQEIHQFPKMEHLAATTKLKEELISSHAAVNTIAKVTELETALSQMFSMSLNYRGLRDQIADGDLKTYLDQFFGQDSWSFAEIAKASSHIQNEIVSIHNAGGPQQEIIPLFKIKSFLIHTFKKNFWEQSPQDLLNKENVLTLITQSESSSLLSSREAQYLRKELNQGEDLKLVLQKGSQWQLKNIEREHFSQSNNPSFTPVSELYQDPKVLLEPIFEKIVRTSLIAEWDRLLN